MLKDLRWRSWCRSVPQGRNPTLEPVRRTEQQRECDEQTATPILQHRILSPKDHWSCQEPAPAWAFHRVTASFGNPPDTASGPTGCRWISASPLISVGCRETSCLTMTLTMGCRENSVPTSEELPPLSSSLTDLGVCKIVCYVFSLLSPSCCCSAVFSSS